MSPLHGCSARPLHEPEHEHEPEPEPLACLNQSWASNQRLPFLSSPIVFPHRVCLPLASCTPDHLLSASTSVVQAEFSVSAFRASLFAKLDARTLTSCSCLLVSSLT